MRMVWSSPTKNEIALCEKDATLPPLAKISPCRKARQFIGPVCPIRVPDRRYRFQMLLSVQNNTEQERRTHFFRVNDVLVPILLK